MHRFTTAIGPENEHYGKVGLKYLSLFGGVRRDFSKEETLGKT